MQQSTGWCVIWWKANAKKFYLSSCTMRVAYHFWCLLWGTPKNECNNQPLWFCFAFNEKRMQNMQPVINFNECCISLLVFVARNTKKLPTINQLVLLLIWWKTNEKNATSHHFRWEFPFHFWFLLRGTPKVNETINSCRSMKSKHRKSHPIITFDESCISLLVFVVRNTKEWMQQSMTGEAKAKICSLSSLLMRVAYYFWCKWKQQMIGVALLSMKSKCKKMCFWCLCFAFDKCKRQHVIMFNGMLHVLFNVCHVSQKSQANKQPLCRENEHNFQHVIVFDDMLH